MESQYCKYHLQSSKRSEVEFNVETEARFLIETFYDADIFIRNISIIIKDTGMIKFQSMIDHYVASYYSSYKTFKDFPVNTITSLGLMSTERIIDTEFVMLPIKEKSLVAVKMTLPNLYTLTSSPFNGF